MCFMSLHSVSTLQSSSASARTAKRFWSSIVNCRLILGHFSFETSSCLLRGSFDVTSLSFSLMFATSRWWSLLTSAPRYTLASCRDLRHLPLTAKWSIWFVVLPSGEFHGVLWMVLCGNIVPPMTQSFSRQNSANRLPLSFIIPHPWLPIHLSKLVLSLPTLAFTSPITSRTSCTGTVRTAACSSSYQWSLSSSSASFVGE